MLSDPEQVTSESTRGRLPSLKADPGKASAPEGDGGNVVKNRSTTEMWQCKNVLSKHNM